MNGCLVIIEREDIGDLRCCCCNFLWCGSFEMAIQRYR